MRRSAGSWGRTPRQDLQSLLPAPEVRELTPGQPADQALIKQLVHLIYDVRRDDARFRNRIGVPGSFDEQRKDYPERRELSALQLSGPFADDRLARLVASAGAINPTSRGGA
jgi:erythronate-4-phosphate dehydrogenase